MLSKKYRFHSRGGVKYVYRHGRTVRTPKLSLVFVENKRKFTRFAVVVSKKVEKSAVKRNLIRRRVYEVLRLNLDKIPKERDYVFVVFSKDLGRMPFRQIEELLGKLVEDSNI